MPKINPKRMLSALLSLLLLASAVSCTADDEQARTGDSADTTDTPTITETAAETEPVTEAQPEASGCSSSLSATAVLTMSVCAAFVFKKKK
jgi:hypothetical protein